MKQSGIGKNGIAKRRQIVARRHATHKAALAKARRRKPEWQDTRPEDEELRESWDVARDHQERFARNFTLAAGALITPAILTRIRSKDPGDAAGIIEAIPFVGHEGADDVWNPMQQRFEILYASAMGAAGQDAFVREGFDEVFTATNPFSQKFIRQRAAEQVVGISDRSRKAMRDLIERGFLEGAHPRTLAKDIEMSIGLTDRDSRAVSNRFAQLLADGKTQTEARAGANRYASTLRRKRALNIARTEMNTAQNRGQLDAVKLMQEAGVLPPDMVKTWVAAVGSPRTCEICLELDGQQVPIGQPFQSSFVGTVDHPGEASHVSCRCVLSYSRET